MPDQEVREFIHDTLVDTPDVFGVDSFYNDDEPGFIVSFRFRRVSIASRIKGIRQELKQYGLDHVVNIKPWGEHTAKVFFT